MGTVIELCLKEKGGESNAKMHLVLTPVVFALRLKHALSKNGDAFLCYEIYDTAIKFMIACKIMGKHIFLHF